MHSKKFKKILAFMISLACATVITNSLMKFIPLVIFNFRNLNSRCFIGAFYLLFKADGYDEVTLPLSSESFFYKHLTFIAVIFFFLNFERIMKLSAFYKKEKVYNNALNYFNSNLILIFLTSRMPRKN